MVTKLYVNFLILILILGSCKNDKELGSNPLVICEKLNNTIENYIDKYQITSPCMINVSLVNFQHNYKAFNISTDFSRDFDFSSMCLKSKKGVDICFYSEIENYINNQDNRVHNVNKNCLEAGMMVVVDSAGVWKTYDNIGLFPTCEPPDLEDLLYKANFK